MAAPARRAYRRHAVVREFGASLRDVDRAIARGEVRTKRRGRCVYQNPWIVPSGCLPPDLFVELDGWGRGHKRAHTGTTPDKPE